MNPLERVVDWVVAGSDTGEAKPRLTGCTDLRAARLRRAWWRLKARRREAIVQVMVGGGEEKVQLLGEQRWRREVEVPSQIVQPIT